MIINNENTIFLSKRAHITGILVWLSKSYKKQYKTIYGQHCIWTSTQWAIPYQEVNKISSSNKVKNYKQQRFCSQANETAAR